jgi:hypothetical protein
MFVRAADRMTVSEAAEHEFLAPELGLKFLRPLSFQGKESVGR